MLMENLLLHTDENSIKYDLKGSKRNRFIKEKTKGKVTLDNNFLQDMKSRPIPIQYSMKRLLTIAIYNDSMYLTRHQIIDYSMFVAIDPIRRTIRFGIIDYV
jgi:1-phosphatidylinositol-3-phosphate 5-kinase